MLFFDKCGVKWSVEYLRNKCPYLKSIIFQLIGIYFRLKFLWLDMNCINSLFKSFIFYLPLSMWLGMHCINSIFVSGNYLLSTTKHVAWYALYKFYICFRQLSSIFHGTYSWLCIEWILYLFQAIIFYLPLCIWLAMRCT